MKTCTCCRKEKSITEFSTQRRNPRQYYAWCDSCRFSPESHFIAPTKPRVLAEEYDLLRSKARELRKFTHQQAVEIAQQRKAGVSVVELSAKFGASQNTIRKAISNPESYL